MSHILGTGEGADRESNATYKLFFALIYSPCMMSVQYIGGCAVHREMFSTLGDIIEYTGGCSIHWSISLVHREVFSTVGDIMSTAGDIMSTAGCSVHWEIPLVQWDECGGYHEYTAGCSVHWGFHTNSIVFPMTFPHIYHDIPQCTHVHILRCTEISRCTSHTRCTAQTLCREIFCLHIVST